MKTTAKRLIAAALCLALTALGVIVAVRIYRLLAYTAGDYTFAVLDDGTAEIRKYRGGAATLQIPSTLKKRRVTRVGMRAFEWRFPLRNVTVPEGVVAIDEGAFAGCYALSTVKLPGSLTVIGERAFANCRSLEQVTLPEGLTALGGMAFDGCGRLTDKIGRAHV